MDLCIENAIDRLWKAIATHDVLGVAVATKYIQELGCVNAKSKYGNTALAYACQHSDPVYAEILLNAGADIDAVSDNLWTPLMAAAYVGRLEVIKLLIKHGANVNTKCHRGWTPLMYAVWHSHKDIAELLITHGANVLDTNRGGQTAYDIAYVVGDANILELLSPTISN